MVAVALAAACLAGATPASVLAPPPAAAAPPAAAPPPAAAAPQTPATPAATAAPARYLQLAAEGLGPQSARWHTAASDWYCEVLRCPGAYPLLTIWGAVRMFEAANAIQIADPTRAHRATVDRFAGQSEKLYWNHYLAGYDPYPGDDYPAAQAWFDDNGWLGLAFVDAYRATGERRWLGDAQRAFDFIVRRGWAPGRGMWWNVRHDHISGEALAAASLLGVLLHQATGAPSDLARARMWIDWANAHDTGFHGLYDSGGPGSSVIDYVEAPLIYAQQLLCQFSGDGSYCDSAARRARALTQVYGTRYDLAPLYDSIFLQWMMAYGRAVGDMHWLTVAAINARGAMQHATDRRGLWLGSWWGGPIADRNTQPDMFRTMAGTTSLYAWLAVYASGTDSSARALDTGQT